MSTVSRAVEPPLNQLDTYDTVFLDETRPDAPALGYIDQTLLPHRLVVRTTSQLDDMVRAIKRLEVRGAPALGVSAAIGVYAVSWQLARNAQDVSNTGVLLQIEAACDALANARPTAVNLSWAVEHMRRAARGCACESLDRLLAALRREAVTMRDEDVEACRAIGEHGAGLLHDGDAALTHCNAGRLCAVRYGTATAPVYVGRERGLSLSVLCDETRPLLQGARLTALELSSAGVPTTLICDNMSASMMRSGLVQAVFVGCDRVAANGDAANKIGTSLVALAARYYGVPFYVCAPTSTIDLATSNGAAISIEERAPREVTDLWYERPMAPQGIAVRNPAFDVTDADLVTAFVTDRGIVRPPFVEGLRRVAGR